MPEPPKRLERVVEAALGCSVRSVRRATGGRVATTYLLELDAGPGRVVCKLGGPSVRTGDVVEPLVVRLVSATTGLPCPAVLASGTLRDGPGTGTRWALYECCDGVAPTPFRRLDPATRRRVLEETGAMLGELHATHQFERTGGLGRRGERLVIRSPAGMNVPERGRQLVKLHPACDGDWQPVLGHGDLFPGNLLVDGGEVSAVLDWGNAHVTTAGYALARAELRFVDWFRFRAPERDRLRDALRRGYRHHRPLPPDYGTAADFYKLLWLGQSLDRHVRNATSSRGRRQLRRHVRSLLP